MSFSQAIDKFLALSVIKFPAQALKTLRSCEETLYRAGHCSTIQK